jgi:hypothetical protein
MKRILMFGVAVLVGVGVLLPAVPANTARAGGEDVLTYLSITSSGLQGRTYCSPYYSNENVEVVILGLSGFPYYYRTFNVVTDACGTVTVDLGTGFVSDPAGYNIWIKPLHYLAVGRSAQIVANQFNVYDCVCTYLGGDTQNDNIDNSLDYSAVQYYYGHSCGEPRYSSGADINGDCAVGATDFNLVRANFGHAGAERP